MSHYDKVVGQYENAAIESQRAIQVDPDFSVGYSDLAANQVDLDHLAEAESTLGQAAPRGLEIDEFIMADYDIAFLKRNEPRMQQAFIRACQDR